MSDDLKAELHALTQIVEVMSPMSKRDRALVLLFVTLKCAPDALTEQQLMSLVRQCREAEGD